MARRETVGVLGGTFDPIHNGHLVAASCARHALGLPRMLLVPAGEPWQKSRKVVELASERLALVEVAVEGIAGLEVSTIEVDRPGPSFTVDTVEALVDSGIDPVLVVGADVLETLATWHRVERIRELARFAVVTRAGAAAVSSTSLEGLRAEVVEIPALEISSTEVRARLAAGAPVAGLVPAAVVRRIESRHLYTAA